MSERWLTADADETAPAAAAAGEQYQQVPPAGVHRQQRGSVVSMTSSVTMTTTTTTTMMTAAAAAAGVHDVQQDFTSASLDSAITQPHATAATVLHDNTELHRRSALV